MHGRYGICSTEVVWSVYTGGKQEIDVVDTKHMCVRLDVARRYFEGVCVLRRSPER